MLKISLRILKLFYLLFSISICTRTSAQSTLQSRIDSIANTIDGRVGMYATLIETKESIGYHAGERYPMQSVYKFPIAMAMLDAVDKKKFSLSQKIKVDTSDFIPKR